MPTSAKPKPRAGMARTAAASLSKPAASPTGLGNSRPKRVWRSGAASTRLRRARAAASARHRPGRAQGAQADAVGGLGVEPEEQAAEGGVDGHGGGIVPSRARTARVDPFRLFDTCGILPRQTAGITSLAGRVGTTDLDGRTMPSTTTTG